MRHVRAREACQDRGPRGARVRRGVEEDGGQPATGLARGWFAALLWLAVQSFVAAQEYPVTGLVLDVDRSRNTFTASIQAIPGVMPAMAMPFEVRQGKDLDGLVPGATAEFVLVLDKKASHAERIRIVRYRSAEQDPLAASRLKLLTQIAGAAPRKALAIGETVPDFSLTNQERRPVALSDLRGKVVAINFIYTSCALPNFCLRIANNFGVLQKRFKARLGRDLVLVTVTFDPVHDTPEVLARYARQWSADPATWHFLTGQARDVQRVCHLFGVDSFPDEGLMNHSLHTAMIDRQGNMVANIEGNRFTSDQLADLTEAVLDRAPPMRRPVGSARLPSHP
jgi:protein SCO1/2